jgi:carboxypeptidase Taq
MFSPANQHDYSVALLEKVGFDLNKGRLDTSPHPFSTSFHPTDCRITTAINERDLMSIWSTLHEAGHGMYEQGLLPEESHMPSGWARSLSLHESQSRFWENVVGKSFTFWKNEFPFLREFFKSELHDVTPEDFWRSACKVQPSPVRIDADELTYHLHVIIRYEIEKAVFEENFPVELLPKLWNEKYREYLGIEIESDSVGILQDVHWSHGMFGYFPTYTLGSLYAAQFYQRMKRDIDIVDKILKEDYSSILKWLRENVHNRGGIYSAEEICVAATAEPLNISHFVSYVNEKYGM